MLKLMQTKTLPCATVFCFRMRPDKKAMRNSLVRFGKRAAADTPNYPALIDDDTLQLENGAIIELGPFAYNDRLNLHRFYPQDNY
uniref:Uncharacterized protein n=1 Tax=Panagrolaimus sp. ES5 TaxID=591445 RepID=A0AC34G9Y6_9BILA